LVALADSVTAIQHRATFRPQVTSGENLPINGVVTRSSTLSPPTRLAIHCRPLLACGVVGPLVALAATLIAMAAYPGFNPARQYLSELGGVSAGHPLIFNAGVFCAGLLTALAGLGFGLAMVILAGARIVGGLTAVVFLLAGAWRARRSTIGRIRGTWRSTWRSASSSPRCCCCGACGAIPTSSGSSCSCSRCSWRWGS
jgi:hypothetical protein